MKSRKKPIVAQMEQTLDKYLVKPEVKVRCPYCQGDKVVRRGRPLRKWSDAQTYVCKNPNCSHYMKTFTVNETLRVPPYEVMSKLLKTNYRKASNKIPGCICAEIFKKRYFEHDRLKEIADYIFDHTGISVSKATVSNILERLCGQYWDDMTRALQSSIVKRILGFQYGPRRYYYLIIDTSPFTFKIKGRKVTLWDYVAIDYPSKLILSLKFNSRLSSEITKQALRDVKRMGYEPNVIICDMGRELLTPISIVFPSAKIQYCVRHFTENVEKKLIRSETLDPNMSELRKWCCERVKALLHLRSKDEFIAEVKDLQSKSYRWQHDKVLKSVMDGLFNKWQRLITYLDYPGCPNTTNPIEGIHSMFDKKIKKLDIYRSPMRLARHLYGIAFTHNYKVIRSHILPP